jgi:putative membrane protein
MWHDWNDMSWWGWTMMIAMTLFWLVVVVAVAVWVARKGGERPLAPAPPEPSATELLDRRLAKGDIDVEEYERRREALRAGHR